MRTHANSYCHSWTYYTPLSSRISVIFPFVSTLLFVDVYTFWKYEPHFLYIRVPNKPKSKNYVHMHLVREGILTKGFTIIVPEVEEPSGVDNWTYKTTRFKVFEVNLTLRWSGRSWRVWIIAYTLLILCWFIGQYLVDMGIYYISSTIYYYINKVKLSRGCVKWIYCLITKWLH